MTFIVIDGTDGSGKATQTDLLIKRLKQSHDVEVADFPRYGKKSAAMVEEYLKGTFGTSEELGPYRASIFYAIDRYAASFQLRKWLDDGKVVVSNRYVSASMGHQAGKIHNPEERRKFLLWLLDLEYNIFGIPKPDLTILLCVPPDIGQQLVDKKGLRAYLGAAKRDIHEADIHHLRNAYDAYLSCAKEFGWLVVDCAPEGVLFPKEEIHELLWEKIKGLVVQK